MVRYDLPVLKYTLQYVKYLLPGFLMYVVLKYLVDKMSYSVVHLIELVLIGVTIYTIVFILYMLLFERKQLLSIIHRLKKITKKI